MTRFTMSSTKQLLAVLGLSCICVTGSLAEPAGSSGLQGRMAVYQFDGIYKGNVRPIAANDESCPPGREIAVDVRNARFNLPWREQQAFDAKISRDGSFYATIGSVGQAEKHMTIVPTLQGRIGTTGLVADYGTRFCRYRLEASQSLPGRNVSERTDGPGTRQ